MNNINFDSKFEETLDTYKLLYKAYQDGYIMENEQTLSKWIKGMGELIVEIGSIRQGVVIKFYNNLLEKEILERISDIEEELKE